MEKMIDKDMKIESIEDLTTALAKVKPHELDDFIEYIINYRPHEACRLVKPGNFVEIYEEGFFCSNCSSRLTDEEAGWHYCNHCLAIFDCCDRFDEPCEVCSEEIAKLILTLYTQKRN